MIMIINDPSEETYPGEILALEDLHDWLEGGTLPIGFQFNYEDKIWTVIPGFREAVAIKRSLGNGKFAELIFRQDEAPSYEITSSITIHTGLTNSTERVLAAIGSFLPVRPSSREVAAITGLSSTTAHHLIKKLRTLGILYPSVGKQAHRDVWFTNAGYAVLMALT